MIGAVSGFLAVATGAFGAHGLSNVLDAKSLQTFHTGAQYQMYHALALIGLGAWAASHPQISTALPGWAFVAGSVIFSGSLYALSLTGVRALGAITPFGGLAFMVGWLSFAWVAFRGR